MASVMWHFFDQVRADGRVRLFEGTGGVANGEQRRDFVFIDDVVKVNLHFLESGVSGIYNLGTGRTGSDSIRRFPYQLWIYRTDSRVHSTPAMILDPRTIDPTLMVGIRGIEGVDVDNDSIDDLVLRVDGSSRNGKPWQDSGEVWIYKGGKEFQVEQPSVQIRSIGTMEQGTHNVSFIHLDGDQKLDMVIGARQAGGARLKFYFSDDNSPYSWANRPPDREISLYPATNLYLSHRFELVLTPGNRADVLVTMAEGRSVLRTLPFDRGAMCMGAPLSNSTGADLATLTVAGVPSQTSALVLPPTAGRDLRLETATGTRTLTLAMGGGGGGNELLH